jgi:hypothetical protein
MADDDIPGRRRRTGIRNLWACNAVRGMCICLFCEEMRAMYWRCGGGALSLMAGMRIAR